MHYGLFRVHVETRPIGCQARGERFTRVRRVLLEPVGTTSIIEFARVFVGLRSSLSGMLTAVPHLDFDPRFAFCRGARVEIAVGDRFSRTGGFRGKRPSESHSASFPAVRLPLWHRRGVQPGRREAGALGAHAVHAERRRESHRLGARPSDAA
jgi:hypothetical protein